MSGNDVKIRGEQAKLENTRNALTNFLVGKTNSSDSSLAKCKYDAKKAEKAAHEAEAEAAKKAEAAKAEAEAAKVEAANKAEEAKAEAANKPEAAEAAKAEAAKG
jgi:hypothetical protein